MILHIGYNEDKIIINDFSVNIKPGQKVAIVGPTGAGKTTIVKLLMRFYELNGGKILIDGHDYKDFTRNELRKMFGMVLQDGKKMSTRHGRSVKLQDVLEEAITLANKYIEEYHNHIPFCLKPFSFVQNEEFVHFQQHIKLHQN